MNAGRVELDLVAVGRDEVSAMLRTLERNVKATAGEMNKAAGAAQSFGDKVDGVKQSIAPVNKLKEVFNQVRENALFVVGAVAGVVVGLGELSDAFSSNASAVKAWGEEQKHVKEYLEKTQDLIENVSRLLGEPQKNELEKASEKVLAVWSQNNTAIETAQAGLAALKDQQLDIGRAIGTWAPEYHRLANEIAKTETMIAEMMRDQGTLIEKNTKLLREQARVAGVGFRQDVENAGGQPFFQRWPAPAGDGGGGGGGGGGGRRRGPDQNAVFQFASPEGQFDLSQTFADRVLPTADALEAMTFGGRGGNAGSDLVTVRTELDKLTESMSGFAASLAEVSPEAGAIAEGLAAMVTGFSAGGQAAASGAKQTLGALGQIMGGKQGLFIGEGLGEEAAVAASLAVGDVVGAGFHQAAATGYFVAAAAMGKGGSKGSGSRGGSGGGGGGSRGGSSGGGGSGPTTVVYNINALVADPHAVRRANAEADRSTRGSGVGMRWGS